MSFSTKVLAVGIIIGMLIGLVSGYVAMPRVDIDEFEQRIDELEDRINNLQNDVDNKNTQIATLQAQISEKDSEITDLENQIDEKNAQISSLHSQIANLESEIDDLKFLLGVPIFSPPSGTYRDAQKVTIATSLSGAEIYYTLDGSDPTVDSLKYSEPIKVCRNGTTTIRSVAIKEGLPTSAATATYTIDYGDVPLGEIGGLHYVYWDFGRSNFHNISITVRIYNEPNLEDGLYLQMYQGIINGEGFYFGIQTDVYKPGEGSTGRGLIFSRWGTRDLSNVKTVEGGWSQSAGYEGDFVGIRKHYEWTTHAYRLNIAYIETDDEGDWYGVWIWDLDEHTEDFLGSIRFPKTEPEKAGIQNGGITWTELYYKKVQETPIPTWHISIKEIYVDEGQPLHATSAYSGIDHTDIYWDKTSGEIHFVMGHRVDRERSAGQLF